MTFLPDPEGPKSAKEAPNLAKLKEQKNIDVRLKTKDDCLHR